MVRRGIARLRIQEVAKEAGLSQGALYRYFDGKEDLLLAVILDSVPRVAELADLPTSSVESATGALETFVAAVYRHEERMAQIAVTVLADDALHRRFQAAVAAAPGGPENFPRLLQSTLDRYQATGAIPADVDTHQAAMTIQARCFHHAVLTRLHGNAATHESAEQLTRNIAAGLVQGSR